MFEPFFRPGGVAVIGASRNPHKLGYGVVRNLSQFGYRGEIYPVNRSATEILGFTCYSSVGEVPDPVDLAVIIVPAQAVPGTLAECGERGIRYAIVVSGGFSETGPEGKDLEISLKSTAEKYDIRVIGPNCIGTIDTHTPVNTTFVTGMPEPGEIGFSSQSGAMVAAVIDWARGAGVGFSRIVSLGNQVDVNETQMIETLKEDPQTQVITTYIEGVADGRAFMDVTHRAASEKPVIVLKGGHGESGARAVASHTGALAGSSEAYKAAFKRSGALHAKTMEEMFDWARALAWQPLPKGKNVAVLTNAGGPAILAVDALEKEGLNLAELTDETRSYLSSHLPKAASNSNPVDVLAGSGPGTYAMALDALLNDKTVDAAVVIQAPQDWFLPVSLAEVVGEVAGVHDKPVIASIMGKASIDDALKILHKRKVPNVAFPERVASVLSAMVQRYEWLHRVQGRPEKIAEVNLNSARSAAVEQDWEGLLKLYDIQFPSQRIAETVEQALEEAEKIGYPVVLKLESGDLNHKSDVGGVKLDIRDAGELKKSWSELEESARKAGITMDGAVIQKMLNNGQEVIIGIHRDEQFGPLVVFGSGGVDVELFKDVKTAIAPLNRIQAGELVNSTKAGQKLKGWRHLPKGDIQTVVDTVQKMAQLSMYLPEIKELEINPLYVMPEGEGAFAVDVRGTTGQPAGRKATEKVDV